MIHALSILALLVAVAFACTPAERAALPAPVGPVANVVDSVGRGLAQVMRWCDDNGIDPAHVVKAAEHVTAGSRAVAAKDYDRAADHYGQAYVILLDVVESAASNGRDVPPYVTTMLDLTRGAVAARAVGAFARWTDRDADAP